MLFLGIDGGQSSTRVLIGDESGRVIGSATGGPCNHVSNAEAQCKFTSVIMACVSEACASAGIVLSDSRFASTCCGMSGGPEDKAEWLARILPSDRLSVKTDGEIALFGAMKGGPGIIVIAGTGSIAFGRGVAGQIMRAGGWGYVFGDEGSAFDIARQAVRASLRFEEGWGGRTALHGALLDASLCRDANEMLHVLYTREWPRSRTAALASIVDAVSSSGDSIARGILEQAGQSLASLAVSIQAQLFAEADPVRVAPIGGVFRSQTVYARFKTLVELRKGCRCVEPELGPAAGALLEAYREAGLAVALSNVPSHT